MGPVEADEVVPQQEVRASGEVIQLGKCREQPVPSAGINEGFTRVPTNPRERADALVPLGDLQVHR